MELPKPPSADNLEIVVGPFHPKPQSVEMLNKFDDWVLEQQLYTDGVAEGWVASSLDDVPGILDRHGVCIVPNLLSPDECATMRDKAWETFEDITHRMDVPLKRDDPSTHNVSLPLLSPHHGMLHQHFGAGQGPHAVFLRNMEKVAEPFEKIWGTHKLMVSLDGCSFAPPNPDAKDENEENNMHFDQSLGPKSRGVKTTIQSWVTSEDVGDGDGTLQFLTGSHLLHKEYGEHVYASDEEWMVKERKGNKDWFKIRDLSWFHDKGCKTRRIKCPAGSMVLWDSRTAHSGVHGKRKNLRNVVYLCYLPAELCSAPALLAKRRAVFDKEAGDAYLRTYSHRPDKMRVFSLYPSWPRKPRVALDAHYYKMSVPPHPELTLHGRRVCGLEPWPMW
jgi:ectoine hydroxylase-related dioxygenase (phytanoyl-CoA dioxygenase family)